MVLQNNANRLSRLGDLVICEQTHKGNNVHISYEQFTTSDGMIFINYTV